MKEETQMKKTSNLPMRLYAAYVDGMMRYHHLSTYANLSSAEQESLIMLIHSEAKKYVEEVMSEYYGESND